MKQLSIFILTLFLFSCSTKNAEEKKEKVTVKEKTEIKKQEVSKKETKKEVKKETVKLDASLVGMKLLGNEPFWNINLNEKNMKLNNVCDMNFSMDYRKVKHITNGWEVTASEADTKIVATILNETEYDDMSGHVYPCKAKIIVKIAGDEDIILKGVALIKGLKTLEPHPENKGNLKIHEIPYEETYKVLDEIKFAIQTNNLERLAKHISFPLRFNVAPGKSISIKNTNDLKSKYQELFTEKLKKAILDIDYKTVGENSSGIFPDGGVIWLTTKNNKVKLFVINKR